MTSRDALLASWEQTSREDKLWIILHFGSFGNWMNANLKQLGRKLNGN